VNAGCAGRGARPRRQAEAPARAGARLQGGQAGQRGQLVVRQAEAAQRTQAVQAGQLAQAVGCQVQRGQPAQPGQALHRGERVGRQVQVRQLPRLRRQRAA